jgi:glucose-6-phosphate-specific signal transduction histidine kinase
MSQKPGKLFNSRKYQGQVERELIVGAILITLIVGGGLIALIWGKEAFFAALLFFGGALLLAGLVWGFLKALEIMSRD